VKESRLAPLIIFFIILFDQTSKYKMAVSACNRGIAFGVSESAILISVIVLLVIFIIILRAKKQIERIGFLIIFAGGLSNLLDRLVVGCVRDFVKIGSFPIFNFADLAITIGVCILLWGLFSKSFDSGDEV